MPPGQNFSTVSSQTTPARSPNGAFAQPLAGLRHQLIRSLTIGVLRHLVLSGTLTIIDPDARRLRFGKGKPEATMVLRNAAVWEAFPRGATELARAYADGLWDSPDLVALAAVAAANLGDTARRRRLLNELVLPASRRRLLGRGRPTERLVAHDELSTGLYAVILGPGMNRSCAYFQSPDMSLADAHRANLDLICDQLEIGPDDHVLEIGNGWGAFAIHAAQTRNCRVTTTISDPARVVLARQNAAEAGLSDRVTVIQGNHDNINGRFDKIVAIEVFDAVSTKHIQAFLKRCSRLLRDDGAMLLQTITVDDHAHPVERLAGTFMTEELFIGHPPPSLRSISLALARSTDLQLAGVHDMTAHYVKTLRHRRVRFLARLEEVSELGYDRRFQRLWTLYMAYGEGAFAQRRMNELQLLLVKPAHRTLLPN